jgi:hypothetical protein
VLAVAPPEDAAVAQVDAAVANDGDASFFLAAPDADPFDANGVFEMAYEDCDGGCPAGDFCYAMQAFGGGKRNFDPGMAPAPGCHPIPSACASDASCACLMSQPHVTPCTGDCIIDDAGTPVVRCLIARP